jgi:flagellar hook-associated protein 2
MSTAGISFGGLASGLDTKAIITALVAVERLPITALEDKKTTLGQQKSLFGDLRTLLDSLTTAAKALARTTDFLQMKAASDDETIATATASSSATPGTHRFKVLQLATGQVNASSGTASSSASLGSNTAVLQIDIGGNTHQITVNPASGGTQPDATLDSIAAAINAEDDATNMGVRAEVVDTGNTANGGASRYQLVVRGTKTGVANAFTISYGSGDAEFQSVIDDVAGNRLIAGDDARIDIGGIVVRRASNQVGDLIPGVTLDLKSAANPTKDVTVTISTDAEATTKKVQAFVDAYNKVVDFFTEQNALDADGKAKNPLFGDTTLRSMRSNLRTVVGAVVSGSGNEAYEMLSQIGVNADRQGKLTLDATKLANALGTDENAVAAVFTNPTGGIAKRLADQIDVYTDSVDGLLKSRTDGYDRLVHDTQDRIDAANRRLTVYQQQLEQKYANLESLMSQLQSQGSSLGSLASLPH